MFRKPKSRKHQEDHVEKDRYTIDSESTSVSGGEVSIFFKELPKGINEADLTISKIGVRNKQGEDIYHINRCELFVPHNGIKDPSIGDELIKKGFVKSEKGYTLITEKQFTPENHPQNQSGYRLF